MSRVYTMVGLGLARPISREYSIFLWFLVVLLCFSFNGVGTFLSKIPRDSKGKSTVCEAEIQKKNGMAFEDEGLDIRRCCEVQHVCHHQGIR